MLLYGLFVGFRRNRGWALAIAAVVWPVLLVVGTDDLSIAGLIGGTLLGLGNAVLGMIPGTIIQGRRAARDAPPPG